VPFGLTLHPFDLATNKVLALVGRVEVRDWIDTLESSERIQPLGYLAWAASGKDPGFSPLAILEHAARSSRYSAEEVAGLVFDGPPPDAATLSRTWHRMLEEARVIVETLPASHAGLCVLQADGSLYTGDAHALRVDLAHRAVRYHRGCIRGVAAEPDGERCVTVPDVTRVESGGTEAAHEGAPRAGRFPATRAAPSSTGQRGG
jgi:hypothetical protein